MTEKITEQNQETAECRGCKRKLRGKPYCYGGDAFHSQTGERCPSNYYGGFVCSKSCDTRASLELEQSMPGHGMTQKELNYGSESWRHVESNWRE